MAENDRRVATTEPIALLLETIPEYREQMIEESLGLPYIVYGFFALYLLKSVYDSEVIRRVFTLLNSLCESGDRELQNLVQVAVFESIAVDRRWVDLAEQHLCPEGLQLFAQIQNRKKL